MNIKRLSIVIGIALLIVVVGVYWSGDTPDQQHDTGTTEEKTFKTADFNKGDWNVSEEASVDLQSEASDAQTEAKDAYNRFTIPGRVTFPKDVRPTNVKLRATIKVLTPKSARKLAKQDNPIRYMFEGGAEEKFNKETLTKTIQTDEQGKFAIKNAPPGLYDVTTADTNWTGKTSGPQVEAASRVRPLELSVSRTARLVGHVVDQDSNPVAARIAYTTITKEMTTDENGRFSLDSLAPGDPIDNLKILKDGFKPNYLDEPPLEPGEVRHDTFVLRKGAQLKVKVRDSEGNPIKQGRVILNRADDQEITSKHHLAAAHGGAKMASIQENGEYTFANLRPGKVSVTFRYSDYIPKVKTTTVTSGELSEVTLTLPKGKPVNIKLINERNGEAITSVQPRLRVYDREGDQIKPGYNVETIKNDGTIKAYLHPEMHRFEVHARSRLGRFEPKKKEFTERNLPDVSLSLVPSDTPKTVEPPTPPGLLSLEAKESVDWSSITRGRVFVVEQSTGRRVHVQAGSNDVLSEPLPLEKGEYVIYGLFERGEGKSLGFLTEAVVESKHPGKRTVELRETSSVEGALSGLDPEQYTNLKIGISLVSDDSVRNQSASETVYYPGPLKTTPDREGNFKVNHLPAGANLSLHVLVQDGAGLQVPVGSLLGAKPLPTLSPGETRSIASLDLGK